MKIEGGVPYTLSLHFYPSSRHSCVENHLDLFLDVHPSRYLVTYQVTLREIRHRSNRNCYKIYLIQPHQRQYLSYQGKITMNRGKIRVINRGTALLPKAFDPYKPDEELICIRSLSTQNVELVREEIC